ncbi:IQ domain-containing protein IQM5-like [Rutidosis leptorrhynchoides]|uniref:IQ domain-containing protein IQM5-like n=1 Tax=Rutidosis leptorrhynchoides TaxID=125765 RepID=UPI003A9A4E2C
MGVTFLSNCLIFTWFCELITRFFGSKNVVIGSSKPENLVPLERCFDFKNNLVLDQQNLSRINGVGFYEFVCNPRPLKELDHAALTIQKFYKSYRTRRNLADCAVVVEELWWKALEFDALSCNDQHESAVSRWGRARTMVAKVAKGLCKDKNAQKLAMCHWLEAIDPRHRYGHNLQLYYNVWFRSQSSQPFFYWLDVGDGREISIESCPRNLLHYQCIKYLGPKEREEFEVIIEGGKLMYKKSRKFLQTIDGTKWIFVLSTSRTLYVGQKIKGLFQHSSFLAGAATTSAGRMVVNDGVLKAVWPYSGHYLPTEENFKVFLCFLQEHRVDLSNVKKCPLDDDDPFLNATNLVEKSESSSTREKPCTKIQETLKDNFEKMETQKLQRAKSKRWTSRIGCVREYPPKLQFQALEKVNLSPRKVTSNVWRNNNNNDPIPSPRPSPGVHLSPRLVVVLLGDGGDEGWWWRFGNSGGKWRGGCGCEGEGEVREVVVLLGDGGDEGWWWRFGNSGGKWRGGCGCEGEGEVRETSIYKSNFSISFFQHSFIIQCILSKTMESRMVMVGSINQRNPNINIRLKILSIETMTRAALDNGLPFLDITAVDELGDRIGIVVRNQNKDKYE